jgi:hypothetical protein
MPLLDLDALTNPNRLPRVKLFGREIVVKPLTGASAHRIASVQSVEDSGESMLGALLDVVRSSCPDLTEKEVAQLSVDQVAALVQLSRGQVAEVESMLEAQAEKN